MKKIIIPILFLNLYPIFQKKKNQKSVIDFQLFKTGQSKIHNNWKTRMLSNLQICQYSYHIQYSYIFCELFFGRKHRTSNRKLFFRKFASFLLNGNRKIISFLLDRKNRRRIFRIKMFLFFFCSRLSFDFFTFLLVDFSP